MTLSFDAEGPQAIERIYATPDVVAQRAAAPGERILDVGSGPGFLLAQLARTVGPEGAVRGIDPSPSMNAV